MSEGWKENRLLKSINGVKLGNFDIFAHDFTDIRAKNGSDLYGCMTDAFHCGFIQGQRAASATQRKAGGAVK